MEPQTLTPELASQCLDVWERRLRDPRGTLYASTLLEAALGAPDFAIIPPPFVYGQHKQFEDGRKARQLHRAWQLHWKRDGEIHRP